MITVIIMMMVIIIIMFVGSNQEVDISLIFLVNQIFKIYYFYVVVAYYTDLLYI